MAHNHDFYVLKDGVQSPNLLNQLQLTLLSSPADHGALMLQHARCFSFSFLTHCASDRCAKTIAGLLVDSIVVSLFTISEK